MGGLKSLLPTLLATDKWVPHMPHSIYYQVRCLWSPSPAIPQGLELNKVRGQLGNSTSTCPAVGAMCSLSCLSCLAPYFPPTYWCIDQPPFSDSQTHGLHQFQILLGPGSWRFTWLLTHCCPWTRKASIPCPCHAKLSNPFFAPSYLSREKIVNAIDQNSRWFLMSHILQG